MIGTIAIIIASVAILFMLLSYLFWLFRDDDMEVAKKGLIE